MESKYGKMMAGRYVNYPFTVVKYRGIEFKKRNQEDVVDGYIHLNENLRIFSNALFHREDFSYINEHFMGSDPFHFFPYEHVTLTNEEIAKQLREAFYLLQPHLRGGTCLGRQSDRIEDDPNRYHGTYLLNNGREYCAEKSGDTFRVFDGSKESWVQVKGTLAVIHEEKIDFELYAKSLELHELRRKLACFPNESLMRNPNIMHEIVALEKEVKESLEKIS